MCELAGENFALLHRCSHTRIREFFFAIWNSPEKKGFWYARRRGKRFKLLFICEWLTPTIVWIKMVRLWGHRVPSLRRSSFSYRFAILLGQRKLLTQLWSYIGGGRPPSSGGKSAACCGQKVEPNWFGSERRLIKSARADVFICCFPRPAALFRLFKRGARYQSIDPSSMGCIADRRRPLWQFDCAAVCAPLICDLLAQNRHTRQRKKMFYVFFCLVSVDRVLSCVYLGFN